MNYAVIAENRLVFAVRAMCRMLAVHPRGLYVWLREQFCQRALEDQRQTKLLETAWNDSGKVYGCRKLHDDLCDLGEEVRPNRVWRLARLSGHKGQDWLQKATGLLWWQYSRRGRHRAGERHRFKRTGEG